MLETVSLVDYREQSTDGELFPFLCKPNGIDCLRTDTFSLGSFYFPVFHCSQCLWKEEINDLC